MFMRTLSLILLCLTCGCKNVAPPSGHDPKFLVPLRTLATELKNPNYEWHGPTSREERIPTLNAARALAYRGDDAATTLFDALGDTEIEIYSIMDAISELGIPVHEFYDQIEDRNSSGLREWWSNNQEATRSDRNSHRQQIGLPPTVIGG